ncbi:DUF7500 family protein [Halomicrococcus sp. SG-WS-1]|uniref:DUF7500 family protein n=1 Tax=Halomicrococcus sp. SG-WS-1 TaxID=3439057 RepID=UPI003F7AFE20
MPPARDDSETGDADAGKVLSPDELDIEASESVVSLDDDRYVIGAGDEPSVPDNVAELPGDSGGRTEPDTDSTTESSPNADGGPTADGTTGQPSATDDRNIDASDVRDWLEDDLSSVGSRYGFHIAAKAEDRVSHQQMFSDDVGTVFDGLLMWYAQQVDRNTPVEDVLGILLMESNLRVRYSPNCLRGVLDAHDLSPDDSIADLFDALGDANGIVFPPERASRRRNR